MNPRNNKINNDINKKEFGNNNGIIKKINNKIVPNHWVNFSFSGINQKNNLKDLIINNNKNKNLDILI